MSEKRNKVEFGDFQTPLPLAEQICLALYRFGIRPETIIEPSCGIGNFLRAALPIFGEELTYYGFDINKGYIQSAQEQLLSDFPNSQINLQTQDFFTFDWKEFVADRKEPILFLGNPPWVTNSGLGLITSENVPLKSNINGLKGLDARTGKANFDISEWMLLKLIEAARGRDFSIAVLCKTGVARKILEYCWKKSPVSFCGNIYPIDSTKWFNASVDACLFTVSLSKSTSTEKRANVYATLDSTVADMSLGLVDGKMVPNVDVYLSVRHINGINYYRWRSGIKHDLAKIMELQFVNGQLQNGYGENVCIEDTYLFPLLKATEISKGIEKSQRYVIVTQTAVGEDTEKLRFLAPQTWDYLEKHSSVFADRKSSIYRNQPKYCLFGIGTYSFAPYKLVISGLHKKPRFTFVAPVNGKTVFVDDTCYFIGSHDQSEAELLRDLFQSKPALEFLEASIFLDSKRPITSDVLNRMDVKKIAEQMGRERELERFLERGTVESEGQGLFVFEPVAKYTPGA